MPWPLLVAITFDVAGGPPESINPEWPLAAFSPALDCLAIPATSYARVIHQWARTEGMAYGTPIVAKTRTKLHADKWRSIWLHPHISKVGRRWRDVG